jgi:segregation and condensation protein B
MKVSTEAKESSGKGGPFSDRELAAVSAPAGDAELDEVEPASIDEREPSTETSFEKFVQKSKKLSADRIRTVIESVLFVSDKPLSVDQLFEATGIDRDKILAALEGLAGLHRPLVELK